MQTNTAVRGHVVSAGVNLWKGTAESELEVSGASREDVVSMFCREEPAAFFRGAKSWQREVSPNGDRQVFLENPVFPVPIMKTEIARTSTGVQGRFQGLMKGQANLAIHERDGKTYITESTRVTPNLQPFTFLAEKLPIVGQRLVAPMRRAAEGFLGLPL